MADIKQRMAFLNRIHLFNLMKDEELAGIAERLEARTYAPGTIIFRRGDEPEGFFMIFHGRVKVTRPGKGRQEFLASLSRGDYFGEEALLQRRRRSATVTVVEESTLFFLSRENYDFHCNPVIARSVAMKQPPIRLASSRRRRLLRVVSIRRKNIAYSTTLAMTKELMFLSSAAPRLP